MRLSEESTVQQRYCPVCGSRYEKDPGKPSPCGHVDAENNILLTMPENETVVVAKKIFNPDTSW